MIEEFMDFINSYSMDKKRYWVVSDVYDVKRYEVFWENNNKWSVKKVGDESFLKEKVSHDVIIETFTENKIDLGSLEAQIKADILSQSLYAKIVFDKTKDLLGQEAMDQADEDFKEFNKNLLDTVEKILKKPKLKLVKEDK
tara:strand:- start:901 stop:1323 length:423 start_codon:yes stop_codon:yes gene_type:complete